MLLAKFSKKDAFAFVSYLDCRDVIVQSIRRAGIKVDYSQGFNPHELIFFGPPTSLGVQSACEYMYIVTETNSDDFKEKFNLNAPNGIKIEKVKNISKKPDFYNLIDVAEYKLMLDCEISPKDLNLNYVGDNFEVEDLNQKIMKIEANGAVLKLLALCGQKNNLKISKFVDCIEKSTNGKVLHIEKIKLFRNDENNLIDIDEILFN